VNAGSQAFELVFDPEFLFFESGDPDFIPVRVGHFGVYELFEFLMLFREILDGPLQCHACTSFGLRTGKLEH